MCSRAKSSCVRRADWPHSPQMRRRPPARTACFLLCSALQRACVHIDTRMHACTRGHAAPTITQHVQVKAVHCPWGEADQVARAHAHALALAERSALPCSETACPKQGWLAGSAGRACQVRLLPPLLLLHGGSGFAPAECAWDSHGFRPHLNTVQQPRLPHASAPSAVKQQPSAR